MTVDYKKNFSDEIIELNSVIKEFEADIDCLGNWISPQDVSSVFEGDVFMSITGGPQESLAVPFTNIQRLSLLVSRLHKLNHAKKELMDVVGEYYNEERLYVDLHNYEFGLNLAESATILDYDKYREIMQRLDDEKSISTRICYKRFPCRSNLERFFNLDNKEREDILKNAREEDVNLLRSSFENL